MERAAGSASPVRMAEVVAAVVQAVVRILLPLWKTRIDSADTAAAAVLAGAGEPVDLAGLGAAQPSASS